MMRKSYLSLLLPLFLLFAQQGAVLHELSHLTQDSLHTSAGNRQPEPQKLPGAPCEKCLIFAHFTAAAAPHVPSFDAPLLSHALSGRMPVLRRGADSITARNRGPPFIL